MATMLLLVTEMYDSLGSGVSYGVGPPGYQMVSKRYSMWL
jgi:hypothetical protein